MTIIRISFFIYIKKILNWFIATYTKPFNWNTPPASHVELGVYVDGYISEKTGYLILSEVQSERRWFYFSSTMRGESNGCRWIAEKDLHKHPSRWLTWEFKDWARPCYVIVEEANKLVGCGYDKLGLLGFVGLTALNKKDKWYCSEVVFYLLFGWWRKLISPRRLTNVIKQLAKRYQGKLVR